MRHKVAAWGELFRRRRRPAVSGRDLARVSALGSSGRAGRLKRAEVGARGPSRQSLLSAAPAPSAWLSALPRHTAGRRRPLRSGPGAAEHRGARPRGGERRQRSRPGLPGRQLRQSAGADAGGGSAALGYLPARRGAGRREVGPRGRRARGTAAAPAPDLAGRSARPAPAGPAPALSSVPATPRPGSPPGPHLRAEVRARERAPSPARGAAPSPGPPGTQRGPRSRGDCAEPRIGLRRAVATATSGPPRLGRDGPKCPVPARLMSAAAAPETQAGRYVRGASPGCAPSSADQGRWAGPAEGAAAPERREETAPTWPGERALWRRAPSAWDSSRAGSWSTPDGP